MNTTHTQHQLQCRLGTDGQTRARAHSHPAPLSDTFYGHPSKHDRVVKTISHNYLDIKTPHAILAISPGQAVTLAELTPRSLQEWQQILGHLLKPPP